MIKTVFAARSRRADKEQARKAREVFLLRKASLTRLVANEDFRAWLKYLAIEFHGGRMDGTTAMDEFTQGVRSAFSFILKSLAIAEGAPKLAGEIQEMFYRAVAEAAETQHKENN